MCLEIYTNTNEIWGRGGGFIKYVTKNLNKKYFEQFH